jgi:1-acyl-sn-glycerol-3-phosphate acyltransferase
MAVIGAEQIMKRGSLLLSPGKVRVYFSHPITPPLPSDSAVNEFAEKCKNRLEAMIVAHE